jgi:hypothetical protein
VNHKKPSRIKNRKLMDSFHSQPCIVCGAPESEPAHIKSRGSGGDDTESNIIPLCHPHHQLQHSRGWYYMAANFPEIEMALEDRDFEFNADNKLLKVTTG